MANPNSLKGIPAKGVVVPKTGEVGRKEGLKGGVGQGMEDKVGKDGEFNSGNTSGICYNHERKSYSKDF